MSKTIDILCVIDAETLADAVANKTIAPGTLSKPTSLGDYSASNVYVFMITQGSRVVNDQAQSELTVDCEVGDNIRWTISNPGAGVNHSCMLYDFQSASIGTAITAPICLPLATKLYINGQPDPQKPAAIAYTSSAWQCTALAKTASVQYNWSFQLIDPTGKVVGYFSWDPFIKIDA
jgi:nematocidal protein AidA